MFGWFRKQKLIQTGWAAGAYLLRSRIIIHSSSRTKNNIGWYNQPVFVTNIDDSDERIGHLVREALDASTWESTEDDSELKEHPILREADVATWRQLQNQSKCVLFDTDRRVATFCPMRPVKKSEGGSGFIGLAEKQIQVNWDGTDSELGSALRHAFAASELKPPAT